MEELKSGDGSAGNMEKWNLFMTDFKMKLPKTKQQLEQEMLRENNEEMRRIRGCMFWVLIYVIAIIMALVYIFLIHGKKVDIY